MDRLAELPIQITEGQQRVKDYGFREVKASSEKAVVDKQDMPWLPGNIEAEFVPLAEVTLSDSSKFLYGSAIKGKELQGLASELGEDSEKANKLFYAEVQRYLENRRGTKALDEPKSRRSIRYASNGSGVIRTYFMELDKDKKTGLPVIIRVASTKGKGNEIDALSVLTTSNRAVLARRCLGK